MSVGLSQRSRTRGGSPCKPNIPLPRKRTSTTHTCLGHGACLADTASSASSNTYSHVAPQPAEHICKPPRASAAHRSHWRSQGARLTGGPSRRSAGPRWYGLPPTRRPLSSRTRCSAGTHLEVAAEQPGRTFEAGASPEAGYAPRRCQQLTDPPVYEEDSVRIVMRN